MSKQTKIWLLLFILNIITIIFGKGFFVKFISVIGTFVSMIFAMGTAYENDNKNKNKIDKIPLYAKCDVAVNEYGKELINIHTQTKTINDLWGLTDQQLIDNYYLTNIIYKYDYPVRHCDIEKRNDKYIVIVDDKEVGIVKANDKFKNVYELPHQAYYSFSGGEYRIVETANYTNDDLPTRTYYLDPVMFVKIDEKIV